MEGNCKQSARLPILAVGLSMVALVAIKSGRDALFFTYSGLERLPLMYVWIAMASLGAGLFHIRAMRRWGTRPARVGVLVLVGFALLALAPFTDGTHLWAGEILFVLVPVAFAAVFASVWLLAGDLLEGCEARSLSLAYTRLGAGSMLGGVIGGLVAWLLAEISSPRVLVLAGAVILFVVAAVTVCAHRKNPVPSAASSAKPDPEEEASIAQAIQPAAMMRGSVSLLKNPYVRVLTAMSFVAALAGLLIEFQFYAFAKTSGNTDAEFFAGFYALLNVAGVTLQLLVAPWLQSRLGLGATLMVLPIALIGGTAALAVHATIVTSSALKVTEGGVKSAIYRPMWEQIFLPIERRYRGMAKVLTDGISARFAEGIGAAALYSWLVQEPFQHLSFSWLPWALGTLLTLWVLLNLYVVQGDWYRHERRDPVLRLPDS